MGTIKDIGPDKIVETTTITKVTPRHIDYQDILDCCQVVYDQDAYDPPWENCDGLEHTFNRVDYLNYDEEKDSYQYASCDGRRGFITIDPKDVEKKWGFNEDYRQALGMAKQPYREMVQRNIRSTTEQLVRWYENGWEYFGAVIGFDIDEDGIEPLNSDDWHKGDYTSSIWGFDTEESAKECFPDITSEVIDQLEKDGYIVDNQPISNPNAYNKVSAMRNKIRRQLAWQ